MNATNILLTEQHHISRSITVENKVILYRDRLFIKVQDRTVRLYLNDILWVEAYDYYSKVVTSKKAYLVTQTLKKYGEALAGIPEMMRVHRSYIVNLAHIEEVGELFLTINEQPIPVSKGIKAELLARWQKM